MLRKGIVLIVIVLFFISSLTSASANINILRKDENLIRPGEIKTNPSNKINDNC